jgi:hypothetical protein
MTEDEAKARCAQLEAEHPDRATTNWIPAKQKDGSWAVARIPLPPPLDLSSTSETRPSGRLQGEDPRTEPPWLNP